MSGRDMIRLAILGAGRIGQLHARNILANPRAQLAYVCDPNSESAARLAARANAKVAAVSDILNARDVDGVLITSPATSHISLLTATVRAGKPAFCEKPLSLDVAEAEDAVRSLKSAGARCMLGFHRRYDPQLQKARNSIISGAIGTLFQVTISSHSAALPS